MSDNVIEQAAAAEPMREARILQMARDEWAKEGEIEIDDDAKLSEGDDNGTYVQAWVWVDFSGTDLDKRKKSEPAA